MLDLFSYEITNESSKMKKLILALVVGSLASSSNATGPYTIEDEKSIECLALNIYFETHASSLADAMAVSDVVLNRVNHSKYPNTICGVVHDGYEVGKRTCQFSWYCDGKSDVPSNSDSWEKSRKYARDFYIHGEYIGITEGATHYHATYVKPYWAPTLDRITQIGSHIFYRIKGK
ncbi:cell wall hydrolase [archaeon]|nr:cell wall hydrolase [archaeon]